MRGQSIFDREADLLGRPLSAADKIRVVSKYATISSTLVLIIFFTHDILEANNTYEQPKNVTFDNLFFKVIRAPRGSETRIILYNEHQTLFSSSCIGLEVNLCNKPEFWERKNASTVLAVETSQKKGSIQKIIIVGADNKTEIINNTDRYFEANSTSAYRRHFHLLLTTIVFGVVFWISKAVSAKTK